jgi:outer membrane protein
MKTKPFLKPLIITVVLSVNLFSGVLSAQSKLDNYIHYGLEHNLVLEQKEISLKQAQQSLEIAKSYFLPSINVLTDYTSGQGGRSIEFPIGDLLNPVYSSLNQLTQSDQFPQLENVKTNFFPKNFYDAKVRTSLPLINTDLYINKNIQGQKILLKEYEVEAYRRQLVMEIKTAYYQHLAALSAEKIFASAIHLVNKNIEVNESLLRNGKTLPANLLRAKSEGERVRAEWNNAKNQVQNSRMYFNFLLNRNLQEVIETEDVPVIISEDIDNTSVQAREELAILKTVEGINNSTIQLYKLSRLPKVNAFVDVGSQAVNWQFNDQSRYYLLGVQLSVPVFQGFRNNQQISQSKLELQKSELDFKNTESQLQVLADVSRNNVLNAQQNYLASQDQLTSSRSYFNLIEKGYQQGINTQIEFIDARNQLTTAELQLNLRHFEMLIAQAHLERQTSSFNFHN